MSGFKALNIESDDESDTEIDGTKELQIEDALKLYQTALKYHAEGPNSYERAAEAYQELFQSDIFKYPESQVELQRIELYGPVVENEDLWQEDLPVGASAVGGAIESGPGTLPQILHLSHKNYAQFKLEYLTSRFDVLHVTLTQLLSDASTALHHFVEALDKDDSDLDLWRRTASVGEMLDSQRVARFCLEAVLDGDDEALGTVLALPGLDESLAGEQLRALVGQLEDHLSILQSPQLSVHRKVISRALKQRLESYQKITDYETHLRQDKTQEDSQPSRVVLKPPNSWAGVGDALLGQLMAEQRITSAGNPAIAIAFDIETALEDAPALPGSASPPLQIEAGTMARDEEMMQDITSDQIPEHDATSLAQEQVAPENNADEPRTTDPIPAGETSISLPTRKRSGDVAGIDTTEEGRAKSKRTRLRESTAEDSRQAILDANIQWEYEQQINEIQAADDWMFETVGNLFERVGVIGFGSGRNVRQELQSPAGPERATQNGKSHKQESMKLAKTDLQTFLKDYPDRLVKVFLENGDAFDIGQTSTAPGPSGSMSNGAVSHTINKSPVLSDDGVAAFLSKVNQEWLLTQEVAWKWICLLLRPNTATELSTYRKNLWPEALKTMIVRTLVNFDEGFLIQAKDELAAWTADATSMCDHETFPDLMETLFELHLDIYCLIKEPNSGVDAVTVAQQRDRLQHWADLAREAMHCRSFPIVTNDELSLRFLWATTFHLGASDVSQDHVIECMSDLRGVLSDFDNPYIQLENNAVMPELSIEALDREITRLTTRDFFLKVTTQDHSDPVATIEMLEPLLDAMDQTPPTPLTNGSSPDELPAEALGGSADLVRFLRTSDISVRMLLWKHLRDAYLAIDYKPMVLSCYFNMIKLLLAELQTNDAASQPQSERQMRVLKFLRLIHDLIGKAWVIVHKSTDGMECIDLTGLQKAVSSLGELLQLMQVFNISSDTIRVGQTQAPTTANGSEAPTYAKLKTRVQETQVYTWMVLYSLLKEAMFQSHEVFPTPADDLFDFLRVVHRNLGLRGMCGTKNKLFVHMLKDEFVSMTHIEGYDTEQAQVLYDLYGLNCFLNPSYELIEHHCSHDAFMEKSVALQAVDLLLQQASKLPTKDLIKHPIKETIEKVHSVAVRKKPTETIQRNREVYRAFLKSPIEPLDLFNCLKGDGNGLTVAYVPREDAVLSAKGWYFLMGHLALAKFRSQKRLAQTATEDVDFAIALLNQDLEHSADRWETWFRLAQAYDTKIEESVVWSAEKLNNKDGIPEIVQLQRAAIHCFTMATALAYRSANPSDETVEKMTEMFIEFATRLYASSRDPFGMRAFARDDQEKYLNVDGVHGVSKGKPYHSLRMFTAWKLAKVLYQRALGNRSQSWMLYYMLGKCLWKMHSASPNIRGKDARPAAQEVLVTFIKAIELIPDERKKDSKDKREPVLEPHYKLVSIVHKMVSKRELSLEDAKEALSNTPYARTATFPEEMDEWVPHVLAILKNLRTADKQNWHHRMIARAAQIIYDDSDPRADPMGPSQNLGAIGAKHELTQQMFTKSMGLQVWRPESERGGRHFVYTARYTRFFVQILAQLKDRVSLELLARRVRRREKDIFEHALVWHDLCLAYLKLLRAYASLPEGLEISTFSSITHDDFIPRKELLEAWMQKQDTGKSAALDVLREVQDLKKLNGNFMKPGLIDDVTGDAYAYLYDTVGKRLWEDDQRIKREEAASRPPPPPISPPRNPMMSLNNLMNMDGASESKPFVPSQPIAAPTTIDPNSALGLDKKKVKIGIGRREIRTCAEGAFQKVAASSSQASKAPLMFPRVQVVIESSGVHGGDTSVDTSAPGSIHDSADDESELSELEEEGEGEGEGEGDDDEDGGASITEGSRHHLLFPGLASNGDSRASEEAGEQDDASEVLNVDMIEAKLEVGDDTGKSEDLQGKSSAEPEEVDRMEE